MEKTPLLISGPSGIGKSYLIHHLEKYYPFKRILPTTTRSPRVGEINYVDYHFVSEDIFTQMELDGEFIMSNRFFNAQYAFERTSITSILEEDKIPATEIYTPTIGQFLYWFPNSMSVFLMPKTFELLIERMLLRGDSEDSIRYRINKAKEEVDEYINNYRSYYKLCYNVDNNDSLRSVIENIVGYYIPEGYLIDEFQMFRRA